MCDNPYGITPWLWYNGFSQLCDYTGDLNFPLAIRISAATVVKIFQQKQITVVGNPNPGYPPWPFWMNRMVSEYLVDRPGFAAAYNAAPTLSPYYVPPFAQP